MFGKKHHGTKNNDYNNLYDEGESKLNGIEVSLVKKGDTNANAVIDYKEQKITATTKTVIDEKTNKEVDGVYTLRNVNYGELMKGNYYVKFDFSSIQGAKTYSDGSKIYYIPVAFSSATNGSKALDKTVAYEDKDLTSIATTCLYTNENMEKEYGLSSDKITKEADGKTRMYFDSKENALILPYINLGIKRIPQTDYAISEDIDHVTVSINGYDYKYNYGAKGNVGLTNATINWQTKNNVAAYTRAIYPSDILYNGSGKHLQVDVTYNIYVTNTTKTNIDELYKEQSLTVTSLTNTFDADRYTLNDEKWTASGETATINSLTGFTSIEPGDVATTTITFKVKQERLRELLNSDGKVERFPTEATAKAYHNYTRNDYSWDNGIYKSGVSHKTDSKTKSDSAPYLNLNVGETRKITGTVFKDNVVTTNGQVLGNGVNDDGESTVEGVTVDLLNKDGKTISLYNVDEKGKVITETDENGEEKMPEATTTTDKDGNFVLEGMIPGDYFLRYTYVNGDQTVCTSDGIKVTDDYKSTIVTSDAAKGALNNTLTTDTGWRWYKSYIEGQREDEANYSVAVDNLEQRAKYNNNSQKEESERDNNIPIYAETAQISITVENTTGDEIDGCKKTTSGNTIKIEVTDNGKCVGQNETFKGFNFGIIERPKQRATIEKVISKVRLINSQNNVIFDGNPNTNDLRGVSDLSATDSKLKESTLKGSTFTRIEISENEIYGSTLEIVYTIRVTNISKVNYYGRNYYWFGDSTGANEVTLRINEVDDYLDNDLVYLTETEKVGDYEAILQTDENGIYTDSGETYQVIKLTKLGEIYTNQKESRTSTEPTFIDVNLTAQRRLSSNDDDMEFTNKVKIITMTNANEPENSGPNDPNIESIKQPDPLDDEPQAKVTITPPTGDDKQSVITYTIIGIVALVVLSTGIVIIKKKIL